MTLISQAAWVAVVILGFTRAQQHFNLSSPQSHLQYVQEDLHEWKFETTQSLQRKYMTDLKESLSNIIVDPTGAEAYVSLRQHLEAHCQRVYNGTCQWQFSPPYNSMLASKPPPRQKAAIIYICCADAQEFGDLLWSLELLDLNFNDFFHYPVFIFHENFGTQQMNNIRQTSRSEVSFHRVAWDIPSFLDPRYVPRWFGGYSLGFRHMIRFFTMLLADHPAMADLDYYWRLDSDSFIIGRVWTDPFKFMRDQDFKYGFVATSTEKLEYLPDLWELTEAHRRGAGIVPEWFKGKWNGFSFYTSCTISRVDLWRQPAV